jgi:hypothetical protein
MRYTHIMSKDDQPKQKTLKGREITIPKREDFMRDLKKAAKTSTPKSPPKK